MGGPSEEMKPRPVRHVILLHEQILDERKGAQFRARSKSSWAPSSPVPYVS